MKINMPQFANIEIPLNKILVRLGYASGKTKIDSKTEDIINEEIGISRKLILPQQVIASSEIVLQNQYKISLEPGLIIQSHKLHDLLNKCSVAYGLAVTIGPHLEQKRDEYSKQKDVTKALILDAVGSVAVEELAEITNKQISDTENKKGLKTTMRFSPGYGDWDIKGQKDFLKWLGADTIGIKLTKNYQMLPEKSVSAILGVLK
ncbi:MAG: hypothetical protein JW871_00860 [Endomicrobiales bacterium]|nr:hypothetical protein [Endomicrobiales bacterium]